MTGDEPAAPKVLSSNETNGTGTDPAPVSPARPSEALLRRLQSFRQPTVVELQLMEFLREQVAWVSGGGAQREVPRRPLEPLPKEQVR